jgi:hypothetical protein
MNNLVCNLKCTIYELSKDNAAKHSEMPHHITAVGIIHWAVQHLKQNTVQLNNNIKNFRKIPPIQANEISQALAINWVSVVRDT